ncbi:MAG TPA: M23 family metallopeptidase [Symbiobacteriaceae bacterium]|nr:M23 family metallopeptidase [Symbiobacteriaceae bacterium]
MPAKRQLTVIVIPETGKRTLTFRLSRVWLVAVTALFVGLGVTVAYQARINQDLKSNLQSADELRRANRLQQAEIEAMRAKTDATAEKLLELEGLERQIRELTGAEAPSRSGQPETAPSLSATGGRGGPDIPVESENLPTLGSMLPPEVRAHLFTRRDTLALNLKEPSTAAPAPAKILAQAEAVQTDLDAQLSEMDRLARSLSEGKKSVQDRLDYLAHRPTGYPVSGALLTDRFGTRWSPFGLGRQKHEGLDLATDYGTPVVSTGKGVVIHAGWKSGGYGYAVIIDHGYGFTTMYAHLADTKVAVGDAVERGQVVGWLGNSGLSTGPHVHYEVHVDGVPVDPSKYIQ